jgi:GH18 family chitinase
MKCRASFLTLCLFALSLTFCTPQNSPAMPEKTSFRIVAYATDAIITSLIPYDQLTHINYSFLIPNSDGTFKTLNNSWKLEEIVTAAHEKNVRVSIAVGGWGWDNEFEAMAAVPEARSAFVQNLVAVVDQYHLDGVDIDWEYPDQGQSAQNFLALMKELRRTLPEKEISTAVISFGDDTGLGIPSEVFELVDYVNVMTYDGDIHGSLVEFEKGLEYWSGRGVPKEKINIGVPFYTRPSEISFAKLVQFDPAAAQVDSFEYNGSPEKYNGIPAVQAKTKLAMQNAGGIMFWALDHDAQGEYSLVNAIFEVVHK